MKELLIGAALCALVATPALADESAKVTTEPVTLTSTQMDQVTAAGWGDFCSFCSNTNVTYQNANAFASSYFSWGGANAVAANVNLTDQRIN